jgi:hypothetical protein
MENVFPGFLDPKRHGSIVKRKDEQQMFVETKNGSIWRLLGSDRIEVVGAGPVGVVFSEYAVANPRARNLISPMLRENDGWEAYITTPRGKNHAKDLYDVALNDPKWFCALNTLRDTNAWKDWKKGGVPYGSADEVEDDERKGGMPDALVKQEYSCDWSAALVGSVWGDLIDALDRGGGLEPFNSSSSDIFTSWDLGFTDSTAIWFWKIKDGGVDIIDHYESHGKPLSHYFSVVENKAYGYAKHWLPHDARQTTLSSGVSILNQCLHRWPGQVAIGPDLPLIEGIQAARWMLQQGVRFHPRCGESIEALRQYHYDFDEEKKTFSNRPAHDWSSHSADAFRGIACVVKVSRLLGSKGPEVEKPKPLVREVNSFTLDELFDDHSRGLARQRRI